MAKSKADMIDDIQRMRRSMRASATQIKKRQDLPQFGAESFLKFDSRLKKTLGRKSLSSLDEEQIRTIYRDITYLKENVKSTNLRGAEKAAKSWLPIQEQIKALSKEKQRQVYELYDKFVSQFRLIDKFKYELMEQTVSYIYDVVDMDKAVLELREILDKISEGGTNISDEEFGIRFTQELKNLRR